MQTPVSITRSRLSHTALSVVELIASFREIASDISRLHPIFSPLLVGSLTALLYGARLEAPETRSKCDAGVVEICETLAAAARRNPYTTALVRQALSQLAQRGIMLPTQCLVMLQGLELTSSESSQLDRRRTD